LRAKKKNRFPKLILWITGIIFLNFSTLLVALQIPAVQTELAKVASRWLSVKTGFRISIEQVEIDWLDQINIRGLNIKDSERHDLLSVDDLKINYRISSLFIDDIVFDDATVENMKMDLIKYKSGTLNISKLINSLKKLFPPKNNETAAKFFITKLTIANSKFSYTNNQQKRKTNIFDPNHFSLIDINAKLSSLLIVADTFQADILQLSTKENNIGLAVNGLQAKYLVSPRGMQIKDLTAIVGDSEINKNIVLDYSGYSDLASFADSVNLSMELEGANIFSKDIAFFSPYFSKIKDSYLISGTFEGPLSNFRLKNLDLNFGKGSNLNGSIYLSGLPNMSETFMDIKLKNSKIIENDIEQYIPSKSFKKYNRFKKIDVDGSLTGYIGDFVAYGIFSTDLGTIISDINLKITPNPAYTSYTGKLKLIDFSLGSYIGEDKLGQVTLDGKISGSGMNIDNANIDFEGSIERIDLYGYQYSQIKANGKFENRYFLGSLEIDDPNLKLHTENIIDLRDGAEKIVISGEVDYANLDKLNIVKEGATIKSKIEIDFSGFTLDNTTGYIYLENLYAQNKNQELRLDHLTLSADRKDSLRTVELITENANVKMWGDFNISSAYKDVKTLLKEYILALKNDVDSTNQYYAVINPENDANNYYLRVKAELGNIDEFISLFEPSLSLSKNSTVDINYNHGTSSKLSVQIAIDTLVYKGNRLIGNEFNLDASKLVGKANILASADFQSKEQLLNNNTKFDGLMISTVWNNDKIDFNIYHIQNKINSINDLYGEIHFFKDSTYIHLNRSNISILNSNWNIQDNNYIAIVNKNISVFNLVVSNGEQRFSISGDVSKDPDKALKIRAKNLDVAVLNPIVNKELNGVLSGEFTISELYNSPIILSNFFINSFGINNFLVGNIYSSNNWNNSQNVFDIRFNVRRDNKQVISVTGTFDPFDRPNGLNLNARFMNARLDMAEPFIENIFSDLEGSLSGSIRVLGPLNSPVISGGGSFNDAKLTVNYLNTDYRIKGTWAFDSAAIYLNEMQLTDENNNTASLAGKFTHQNYKNFNIDLQGEMQHFMVLNTSAGNDQPFYGSGIASGSVSFIGPLSDITIKATAKTEKGTKFYVPIGGTSTTEYEEYISFVNFSDTLNRVDIKKEKKLKYTGLSMEFDLEITEDAYAEIIFDITSGDIIRGKGTGHLSMAIDTQGEFTMLGSYEFIEGGYNFTMYNIVNKEFAINPKSKITWLGDPYNGIMDIDAAYRLSTSLEPLVGEEYKDMPDLRRLYPTEVLLSLDGPMLTPDIEFQIIIDDYPKSNVDLDTQIKGFLTTIAIDQQELNRQVFSLLILRKFSPPNAFSSSGGTIGSSVSEFVSNQLSYWISQVDENLTIDMDLGELDEDALKTFQLRISYAFLDGKLIVTRDGGFTDPANNEASVSTIAGDWTLEYLLSEDGKLRIKIFNKTNYNQLNSATGSASQSLVTGGFSLIYTTSFDELSELFNNADKKKKEKDKDTEPTSAATKPEEDAGEIQH